MRAEISVVNLAFLTAGVKRERGISETHAMLLIKTSKIDSWFESTYGFVRVFRLIQVN